MNDWGERYRDGETFRQIAATAGVDESTVRRRVVDRRPVGPALSPPSVDEAVRAVLAAGEMKAAAAELGVSLTAVRHRLWLAGLVGDPIPQRSGSRTVRRRTVEWLEWGEPLARGGLRERIVERDGRIRARLAVCSVDEVVAESGLDRQIVARVARKSGR